MKKLRKLFALAMVFAMVLCLTAACGNSGGADAGDGGDDASGGAVSGDMTIGVVIWSTDDGLGADAKEALDKAAEALGVSLIYRTGDYDAEAQTTAIENLIAAGADGILITTLVDTATDELLKVCEDADIPMQLMFRNIVDEEAKEYCFNSDLFSGYVVEDEEAAGADMVDKLVAEGCKTFGLLNREAGNGVVDRRQAGVQARLDELGLEYHISTNSNTATATDMTDATEQLLAAHSAIDALICSSGSNGAIDAIIENLSGKDIKLTSFDTPKSVASSFDAGNLVMLTTGAQIDPLYALVNLYNFINKTPFSDSPTEIASNYIYLESSEDSTVYDEHFGTFKTYTADEIKGLTEMSLEEFKAEVAGYSLQNIQEKNQQ